jgi:hypothetical protein
MGAKRKENTLIPDIIKDVERPKSSQVFLVDGKYYVNLISSKRNQKRSDGTIIPYPTKIIGKRVGEIEYIGDKYIFRPNKYYANLKSNYNDEHLITDKEYGASKILVSEASSFITSLDNIFGKKDSSFLICYALLKMMYTNIKAQYLEEKYNVSYISDLLKDVDLSKNKISNTLEFLGKNTDRFERFMISTLKDKSNLAIDGTLIESNTKSNSLVRIGRKNKGKYVTQYNLVYIYDYIEKMPKFYRLYSGSTNDTVGFKEIYSLLGIKEGIVIGDRMFSIKSMRDKLTLDKIDYLFPLKETDTFFTKMINKNITMKKVYINKKFYEFKYYRVNTSRYLILFKDLDKAIQKEKEYLDNIDKNKEGYNKKDLEEKKKTFGVFVFESNKRLKPKEAIELYGFRWGIESMNDDFKNNLELDFSNTQGIYRTNTQLFINHLALSIYYQIKNKLAKSETLNIPTKRFIEKLMDIRIVKTGNDWKIHNVSQKYKNELKNIGFIL